MDGLNKNTVVVSLVSIIAIFAFLFVVYTATNKPQNTASYKEVATVQKDDHVKWSPAKKHILVEYSDLQCPACKSYHDYISTQIEASGSASPEIMKNITFVYRHYPLPSIHQHAIEAATFAEAAGRQGKFFEVANKLFETQEEWSKMVKVTDFFMKIAKQLKLDEKKLQADMKSSGVTEKVQNDTATGNAVDVQGTPTFYLDGKKVEGVTSFDEFKKLLSETAKK